MTGVEGAEFKLQFISKRVQVSTISLSHHFSIKHYNRLAELLTGHVEQEAPASALFPLAAAGDQSQHSLLCLKGL